MLQIHVTGKEFWDEQKEEFIQSKIDQTIQLEHSLVSISKWESKWNKPFLDKKNKKTDEEVLDYIKCMTITQNVKDEVYDNLTTSEIEKINDYISKPMTATTFNEFNKSTSGENITSELIYYWMITQNIPIECQKWHINRLLTLIRVCSIKNQPSKKINKKELASKYASLNASRRQQLKSKG